MNYLKKYGITQEEILELKEMYNDGIICFLKENKIFIIEKCEYLKQYNYYIGPILKNNIKIFLETTATLKNKIEKMKNENYSNKAIQMILMDEKIYDEI